MDDQRMKLVESLFHDALDCGQSDRDQLLEESCAGDQGLKKVVETRIYFYEKDPHFLEVPIFPRLCEIEARNRQDEETAAVDTILPDQFGEFKIIEMLGQGGMGIVYRATQESLDREVAVKAIRRDRLGSEEAVARFTREASAISELDHPNVVTVYSSGEENGIHFFAMELLKGERLDEALVHARSSGDPIQLDKLIDWIINIADALFAAHAVGVIHRDIKPANIWITTEGRAKLMDFGIARQIKKTTLTHTGRIPCTPPYASPELIDSSKGKVDHRSDVYSLGVTLYEVTTGKAPFEEDTIPQVFTKIRNGDFKPPRQIKSTIRRDLETIILKAMEYDANRRYQSMADFSEDLRLHQEGKAIKAKPAGVPTKLIKYVKRRPVFSTIAAAVLVLITWGIIYSIQMKIKYEEIQRYSDMDLIYRLQAEEKELWPAYPEKVSSMTIWLNDAKELASRYEEHLRTYMDLRDDETLDSEIREICNRLAILLSGIESLTDDQEGLIKNVKQRLNFAQSVYHESIEKYSSEWDQVIASISNSDECPIYNGLVIKPQLGLVPIGADPLSGLWEFAHIQTGEIPERDEEGKLFLTEETAIVLVLIPGGSFNMGATKDIDDTDSTEDISNFDPFADSNEMPEHQVTLSPYFLSKYEMTQGQWMRFTGENPSQYKKGDIQGVPHSFLDPVEYVSWEDCVLILSRLRLRLPSESEWEYAARAGTTTIWWTGNKKETLKGATNICDLFSKKNGGTPQFKYEEWLDDGYVVHAPVGSYSMNAFGLHDICGNVWEWCQDSSGYYSKTPVDGSAYESTDKKYRIRRGGGSTSDTYLCRSACRFSAPASGRDGDLGLRPARSLDK